MAKIFRSLWTFEISSTWFLTGNCKILEERIANSKSIRQHFRVCSCTILLSANDITTGLEIVIRLMNLNQASHSAKFNRYPSHVVPIKNIIFVFRQPTRTNNVCENFHLYAKASECRALARILDEDLLNAMPEMMTGVALYWYRQSRKHWRTWKDFLEAAWRRCYGVDRRFQQRLIKKSLAWLHVLFVDNSKQTGRAVGREETTRFPPSKHASRVAANGPQKRVFERWRTCWIDAWHRSFT